MKRVVLVTAAIAVTLSAGWPSVSIAGDSAGPAPVSEADRIVAEALATPDVHDCFGHIESLAKLKATPQLARLFLRETEIECCVYQEILAAMAACAAPCDIPVLLPLVKTEEEYGGFEIREILARIAGVPDGAQWTSEQWNAWWTEVRDQSGL